jgi:hypothetical protein
VLKDGVAYHTYSTYARGVEALMGTYQYLDLTPLGQQEEGLDFPQAWWRRHDEHGTASHESSLGEDSHLTDSPVVEPHRAIAIAEQQDPEVGLQILDCLPLEEFHYLLQPRRTPPPPRSYRRSRHRLPARALVQHDAERRPLERRLQDLYESRGGAKPRL